MRFSAYSFTLLSLVACSETLTVKHTEIAQPAYLPMFIKQAQLPIGVNPGDADVATLSQSIKYWNKSMGFELMRLDPNGKISVKIQANLPKAPTAPEDWVTLGDAAPRLMDCSIRFIPGADKNFKVVTHELGHCLGLNHVEDTTSVMYPALNKSDGYITDKMVELVKQFTRR